MELIASYSVKVLILFYQHLRFIKTMKLDQFLKWHNFVSSGGEAKNIIQSGLVKVNGEVEIKRGRNSSR